MKACPALDDGVVHLLDGRRFRPLAEDLPLDLPSDSRGVGARRRLGQDGGSDRQGREGCHRGLGAGQAPEPDGLHYAGQAKLDWSVRSHQRNGHAGSCVCGRDHQVGVVGKSLPDRSIALEATLPADKLEGSGRELGATERIKGQVAVLCRKPTRAHLPAVGPGRHRNLARDAGTHGIGKRQTWLGRCVDADVVLIQATEELAVEGRDEHGGHGHQGQHERERADAQACPEGPPRQVGEGRPQRRPGPALKPAQRNLENTQVGSHDQAEPEDRRDHAQHDHDA